MASSDPYYNRVKPPSGYKTVYNTDGRGVSWLNTKTQKCHNPETIMKPPPKAAPSLSLVRSNKKRQLLSFSDREDALVSAETEAVCLDDYEAGRPDELREKFLCFVKELAMRQQVFDAAYEQLHKKSTEFENESEDQLSMIFQLRKQLSRNEINYTRRLNKLRDENAASDREAAWLNQRREQLREIGARLMVLGNESDRRNLVALGVAQPGSFLSALQWISEQAQAELPQKFEMSHSGLLPEELLFDTYKPTSALQWSRDVEHRSHSLVFDREADDWFKPPELLASNSSDKSCYLRLVQLVTTSIDSTELFDDSTLADLGDAQKKLVVYRFLLIDRRQFGRTALVFDGVVTKNYSTDKPGSHFHLQYWPAKLNSVYTEAPAGPLLEMDLVGVEPSSHTSLMDAELMGKSRATSLRALSQFVVQKSLELRSKHCALELDWRQRCTMFQVPLEYQQGLQSTHSTRCKLVGRICAFRVRADPRTGHIDAVEVLVCERTTCQLVWTSFDPDGLETMINEATVLQDSHAADRCQCKSSFVSSLLETDQQCGAETIDRSIESATRRDQDAAWQSLFSQRGVSRLLTTAAERVVCSAPSIQISGEAHQAPVGAGAGGGAEDDQKGKATSKPVFPASRKRSRPATDVKGPVSKVARESDDKKRVVYFPVKSDADFELSAEEERFLAENNLFALDSKGNPGAWAKPAKRRKCSECGLSGLNNKGHSKPNHGQVSRRFTQQELFMWYKSFGIDTEEAKKFVLVQKK